MSNIRHGNDNYWCFIESGWDGKQIAIWRGPEDSEKIIAYALDKYDAKSIVDALLLQDNQKKSDGVTFGKKELAFLEFVQSQCPEPYVTMAKSAVLWDDVVVYNKLVEDFKDIY